MQAALYALKLELTRNSDTLKPILLARNVHKSVITAVLQTGFDVSWLELYYDEDLDLYTRPDFSNIKEKQDNYSALLITNPSYEGFYSQLPELKIPVIVDEAHGAHYYFSDLLPAGALNSGADLVIQSWHKCLTALTQGGVAHVNKNSKISVDSYREALKLLQSTSPSYLILKSLCEAFQLFKINGSEFFQRLANITDKIPSELKADNNDFTRLLLKPSSRVKVEDFDECLEEKKIYCESFSNKSILFFLSVFHEEAQINYLINNFLELEKDF